MRSVFRTHVVAALAAMIASAAGLASCASELTRTGTSPAYVIVESLAGASGATPDEFGSPLLSDVVTLVQGAPTYYTDLGRAQVRVAMKNPMAPTSPTNAITLNRYRVSFRRTDGRNTQGVDVPFAFDGATTLTVAAEASGTFQFELVRSQAKREAPLRNLEGNGGAQVISTIADVTFYGRDQAGNEVTATGSVSVTFADFADAR